MIPMTTQDFQQYRKETKGCKHIETIGFDAEHKGVTYSGSIAVTEEHRRRVPAYYGSVVFAAVDGVDWYELIKKTQPNPGIVLVDAASSTVQVGGASLPTFQVIGRSEDDTTIYVKGMLP